MDNITLTSSNTVKNLRVIQPNITSSALEDWWVGAKQDDSQRQMEGPTHCSWRAALSDANFLDCPWATSTELEKSLFVVLQLVLFMVSDHMISSFFVDFCRPFVVSKFKVARAS